MSQFFSEFGHAAPHQDEMPVQNLLSLLLILKQKQDEEQHLQQLENQPAQLQQQDKQQQRDDQRSHDLSDPGRLQQLELHKDSELCQQPPVAYPLQPGYALMQQQQAEQQVKSQQQLPVSLMYQMMHRNESLQQGLREQEEEQVRQRHLEQQQERVQQQQPELSTLHQPLVDPLMMARQYAAFDYYLQHYGGNMLTEQSQPGGLLPWRNGPESVKIEQPETAEREPVASRTIVGMNAIPSSRAGPSGVPVLPPGYSLSTIENEHRQPKIEVKSENDGFSSAYGWPARSLAHPQVPKTIVNKRRRSREEWVVVDQSPSKDKPARPREMWSVASMTNNHVQPASSANCNQTAGKCVKSQAASSSSNISHKSSGSDRFIPSAAMKPEIVQPERSNDITGDMSHYFPITPLAVMARDLSLFSPHQQALLKAKSESLRDPYPRCECVDAKDNGPFYIHLGYAASLEALRTKLEDQFSVKGRELRIETVKYSGLEGKTEQNCPVAKWIIRRSSYMEKFLVVAKKRPGHSCDYAVIVASILMYDALDELADQAYDKITAVTSAQLGDSLGRLCGKNKAKTCLCQGINAQNEGQSYTFGCSWSMYNYSACKFTKSGPGGARKFRITPMNQANILPEEKELESVCQQMADHVAPLHRRLAPDCYNNMCLFEEAAVDCRLGRQPGRPYSGITTVVDFCAHSHRDTTNMVGGCTAIVTLTKPGNRGRREPDEEQYHVLPMYVPDCTEEHLAEAVFSGGLTVLDKFTKRVVIGQKVSKRAGTGAAKSDSKKKKKPPGTVDSHQENQHIPVQPSYGGSLGLPPGLAYPLPPQWCLVPGMEVAVANAFSSAGAANGDGAAHAGLNGGAAGAAPDIHISESDCEEAFRDAKMGGVAFSLPHGSLLLEVAKHELHASTALRDPDRTRPCRIGLVFYQHRALHYPHHGAEIFALRREQKEHWRYITWLQGIGAPTEAQQGTLVKSGYVFPDKMRFKLKKGARLRAEECFNPAEFPHFVPGKLVQGLFIPIDAVQDADLGAFKERVRRYLGDQQ